MSVYSRMLRHPASANRPPKFFILGDIILIASVQNFLEPSANLH